MSLTFSTTVGLVAAGLTTAANVPQAYKAWRTRQTDDLSLAMTIILASGLSLWILYGILQSDPIIIVSNCTALTLAISLAILKASLRMTSRSLARSYFLYAGG
jgi:MtN3 and saliva related transmembrane protein